jgi:uncharacterized protein
MTIPLVFAVGLVGWSLVGNLLVGDALYVTRNVLLLVVLLWVARRAGASWDVIGLDPGHLRAGARWGLVAVAVVALAVAVGTGLADLLPGADVLLADERADLGPGELAWHTLWRIPLGTAAFEEVAFRGALLGLLLTTTTSVRAVVISSVVFGLWHVAPTVVALRMNDVAPGSAEGLGSILGAVAITTVAGVLFCLLRLGSGSLLAPALAHWATNSLGLAAAALGPRGGA